MARQIVREILRQRNLLGGRGNQPRGAKRYHQQNRNLPGRSSDAISDSQPHPQRAIRLPTIPCIPGTTWRDRPAIHQREHLWLAGDWVAAPGHLSEVSCNSARQAARAAQRLAKSMQNMRARDVAP